MPLSATGRSMTLVGTSPLSVAVFMQVDGSEPPQLVRVVATYGSIVSLDPQGAVDETNALEVAKGDRMRIESAASTKFVNEGLNSSGEIVLGSNDLP
jgi:hypothetical protein